MRQEIDRFKATDAGRLRGEYSRLVEGLALRGDLSCNSTDNWLANPALPDDILKEAVPGNIRRAEHILHVLRRLVQYLEGRLDIANVLNSTNTAIHSTNSAPMPNAYQYTRYLSNSCKLCNSIMVVVEIVINICLTMYIPDTN